MRVYVIANDGITLSRIAGHDDPGRDCRHFKGKTADSLAQRQTASIIVKRSAGGRSPEKVR